MLNFTTNINDVTLVTNRWVFPGQVQQKKPTMDVRKFYKDKNNSLEAEPKANRQVKQDMNEMRQGITALTTAMTKLINRETSNIDPNKVNEEVPENGENKSIKELVEKQQEVIKKMEKQIKTLEEQVNRLYNPTEIDITNKPNNKEDKEEQKNKQTAPKSLNKNETITPPGISNESMNNIKIREGRNPSQQWTNEQNQAIIDQQKTKWTDVVRKPKNNNPNKNIIITLEEKNQRITEALEWMTRSITIRLGSVGYINSVIPKLKKMFPNQKKLNTEQERQQAAKTLINKTIVQDLKMTEQEYNEIKIETIKITNEIEGEIATITFATKDDFFRVTSRYKYLNDTNKDTYSTAVHNNLKIRYRAWQNVAYKARVDSNHTVSTKIRPVPNNRDFILLIRRKDDKTAWSRISATITSIDPVAIFQVGEISEDDRMIEAAEWHERDERIKKSRTKRNKFLDKQITTNPRKFYKDDNEKLNELDSWLQKVESEVSIIETPKDIEKENEIMEVSESNHKRDHATSSPIKNQESIKSPTPKKNNTTKPDITITLTEVHE